jgi:hypothetical protein
VSFREQCNLIGSYHRVFNKPVDLSRYTEEQRAAVRASKRAPSVTYLGLTFVDIEAFECESFDLICTLFNSFDRHGTLPFEGSFVDQPNKIVETFNVLRGLMNEAESKERKKQEQLAKRRNG